MAIHSPALDPRQPTGLFLEGAFEERDEAVTVTDPYSGDAIATVAVGGPDEVDAAVATARGHLSRHPAVQRAEVLERAARLVHERAEGFARTICLEAGKPIKQARVETARCVDTLHVLRRGGPQLAGEMVPMECQRGRRGQARDDPARADRRRRGHRPVQLPPQPGRPQGRAGDRRRLPGGAEAGLGHAAVGAAARRAPPTPGLPPGFLWWSRAAADRSGSALVDHPDIAMISFTGSPAGGLGHPPRQPRKEVGARARELHSGDRRGATPTWQSAAAKLGRLGLHPRRAVMHLGAAGLRAALRRSTGSAISSSPPWRRWSWATRWTRPPTSAR